MKIETTLDEMNDSYDWQEVFKYADPSGVPGFQGSLDGFTRDDVAEVLGSVEGENDGDSWVGVFRLKDDRFAVIRANCDYTGWG